MYIEIWREIPIKGFEEYYISTAGNVIGKTKRLLKCTTNKNGYKYLTVRCGERTLKIYIHKAVWRTFVGNVPYGFTIHHINRVRGDNRLSNLELIKADEHLEESRSRRW